MKWRDQRLVRFRIKLLLLFFLLFVGISSIKAQQDTALDAALEKMTQATLTSDAHEVLRYSSPRVIKVMGGIERATEQFKRGFENLKEQGIGVDTVINYNKFNVLNKGDMRYKVIPQVMVMTVPYYGKKMISVSKIPALKEDEASGWKFINTGRASNEMLKTLLPEFRDQSIFSKLMSQPLVIAEEEVPEMINSILEIFDEAGQLTPTNQ